MAIVKQIYNLVNDAVADAIGKNANLTQLDTTDIVSLGKAISSYDAYEKFYGALVNRIVKTVYFVRVYNPKSRNVLRDESEYGAFVQKVYTELDSAVENPAFDVTQIDSETGARSYEQHSPYDIENAIGVKAKIFGGQGTWSHEFIVGKQEIKTAFLNESEMMRFIDYLYVTAENSMKLDIERLESTAVNTTIANCIANGKARNLLQEYNLAHPTATLTLAQALEDLDFLKFATKEIKETINHMGNMNVNFNVDGYATFTDKENLVVEVLEAFASATATYLESDTYHNELVGLPKYNEVSYWQNPGNGIVFPFDKVSSIKIKHSDINSGTAVSQSGIICVLRDVENVAAYFGDRRTWETVNPRDDITIHGEQARKGYAVDGHANAIVFYLEYIEPTNKKADAKKAD